MLLPHGLLLEAVVSDGGDDQVSRPNRSLGPNDEAVLEVATFVVSVGV